MKYYLYCVLLIVIAILVVVSLPIMTEAAEGILLSFEIPQNNASVAGIQKYNIPPASKNLPSPQVSARAVFVKDLVSGAILFQKDANFALPIASTTKIMTALVASEYFKQDSPLTVRVGATVGGAKVGLFSGEDLSFSSLLYGMLLN